MRFTADEQRAYRSDGFLLRQGEFAAGELNHLRAVVEEVIAGVAERARRPGAGPQFQFADGHRAQLSSNTVIQWEWADGSREIRLIEPFTHLHRDFEQLWTDARFVEPMTDALGVEGVCPYTCKLHLTRPREGSRFPWHQDYTYWYAFTPATAHEIATAILFLDDSTVENGALRVLAGSHLLGPVPRDPSDPTGFLADPARLYTSAETLVDAPAGSLLFLPSTLVHCSSANTSAAQRRAILLSLQPAGRPRQTELDWRPERVADLP